MFLREAINEDNDNEYKNVILNLFCYQGFKIFGQIKMSQQTTKPTIRLGRPAKTHPGSLIRNFADHLHLLQPPGYP